jgi:transposase
MTPDEFTAWLAKSNPITIVFEACGTSNYWKQKASCCDKAESKNR